MVKTRSKLLGFVTGRSRNFTSDSEKRFGSSCCTIDGCHVVIIHHCNRRCNATEEDPNGVKERERMNLLDEPDLDRDAFGPHGRGRGAIPRESRLP